MNEAATTVAAASILFVSAATVAIAEPGEEPTAGGEASAPERWWQQMRGSHISRIDYFSSSRALDDARGFLGATLQLKAQPSLTDHVDGKLEIHATNSALGRGGDTKARIREAYLRMDLDKADLYVGKQIVPWGRTDGINPTDNLTPRDYKVMLPFEEDQRFGTVASKLDVYFSEEHTLTIFTTPFFEPSKVPLPATDQAVIEKKPDARLSNMEAGLRLNAVREGFDWSVSYFHGFSLTPNVRLIEGDGRQPALELHYDRINAYGADVARNYGRFGLRGEIAYLDTSDETGADPSVKKSHLYWVAGVDRTFYENLNINLQVFQRRVRHFEAPGAFNNPLDRTTALLNSAINAVPERVNNGLSFRVSNQWLNNTLKAELFGVINTTHNNRFLRPLVTYAFDDRWNGTMGLEYYRGADFTQYGILESNRTAFVELRYGF